MKLLKCFIILFILSIGFEIIGTRCDIQYMRPIYVIQTIGPYYNMMVEKLIIFHVWSSNVLQLCKNMLDFVMNYIRPIYEEVTLTAKNIIWTFYSELVVGPYMVAITTYAQELNASYEIFSTILVCLLWIFGGFPFFGIGLECYGIVSKNNSIRPSTYIRFFAQSLYNEFYDIGQTLCKLLNFMRLIEKILKYFNINLKPYLEKIKESKKYIVDACEDLIISPFLGLKDGFFKSQYATKFIAGLTAFILIIAFLVGVYIDYFYNKKLKF
jgi:hypothetical protein